MRLYHCSATCSARNLVSYDTRLFWVVYALRDDKYVVVDDYHHFVK